MTPTQRTALEQLEQDVPETIASRLRSILAESSPPFPKMAERLTHAEQAKVSITLRNINTALVSLDKAAEIERVAREVCAEWDNINNPDELELGRAMDRLRALVEGR